MIPPPWVWGPYAIGFLIFVLLVHPWLMRMAGQ